ncbi:alpha/beta hydrolase [Ramlibacter sp. AN1015]|uniref:alpha/beta hydrolase n=1 Tax=Ramlibacter sp. AN1015 TaxID=3133428 RepID=UPI0030BA6FC7
MQLDDPEWLEEQYNNRTRVPDFPEHFARWARDSERLRSEVPCSLDIAYGDASGERLDVFPTRQRDAPVLVFIHGGYWRALDKSDHSFVGAAFARAGACAVVPNYDLCPAVTIPQIVMQQVRALAWTWRHIAEHGGDPRRIVVAGHSAGGHLAAMLMACDWPAFDGGLPENLVGKALAISGLYELEALRRTPSLQASLQLTPQQVRMASPALLPPPRGGALYTVAGAEESAEFLRHNALMQQAWGAARVPVCEALPGLNHFSILEDLVNPGTRLNALALELLGL